MTERIVQETSLRYWRNSWGGVASDTVFWGRRGIDPCPSKGAPSEERASPERQRVTTSYEAKGRLSNFNHGQARFTIQVVRTTKPGADTESKRRSDSSGGRKGRSATDRVTRCEAVPGAIWSSVQLGAKVIGSRLTCPLRGSLISGAIREDSS